MCGVCGDGGGVASSSVSIGIHSGECTVFGGTGPGGVHSRDWGFEPEG